MEIKKYTGHCEDCGCGTEEVAHEKGEYYLVSDIAPIIEALKKYANKSDIMINGNK